METLRHYLRKYPNRIKYGLLLADIVAMLIAIKVYVNYISIQTTIDNTVIEREMKMEELSFTQNFLIHYEASDYARYFLQHENNMLSPGEYIIKFEENTRKVATGDQNTPTRSSTTNTNPNFITSPQASWQKFISDKTK